MLTGDPRDIDPAFLLICELPHSELMKAFSADELLAIAKEHGVDATDVDGLIVAVKQAYGRHS